MSFMLAAGFGSRGWYVHTHCLKRYSQLFGTGIHQLSKMQNSALQTLSQTVHQLLRLADGPHTLCITRHTLHDCHAGPALKVHAYIG
jgi:hypothetical protein